MMRPDHRLRQGHWLGASSGPRLEVLDSDPATPAHPNGRRRHLQPAGPVELQGSAALRSSWTRRVPRWVWLLILAAGVALVVVLCGDNAAAAPPRWSMPAADVVYFASRGAVPAAPKSGERFIAGPAWREIEPLAWRIATEAGMSGWGRRVFLQTIWNESRGRANAEGDFGCSVGLLQLGLGGISLRGKPCHSDVRRELPEPWRSLPRAAFFDPETNLRAGMQLLSQRGLQRDPLTALATFAGCQDRGGMCERRIWSLHFWWFAAGLGERLARLEAEE